MSRINPSVSEICDALGACGPGNGEWSSDVLSNASSENRAKAQKCLEEQESSR